MADLESIIEEAAQGPAKASNDSGSAEQHKLTDLIAADEYIKKQTGLTKKGFGMRLQKMNPPSAV